VHGIKRFIHVSTDEVYGEGEIDQVGHVAGRCTHKRYTKALAYDQ
jgi:dTDP-D-glucose 4,6-dehydratase